jgi:hypothetical protein
MQHRGCSFFQALIEKCRKGEKAANRIAQAPGIEAHAGAEGRSKARLDCIVPSRLLCIHTRAKGFHCLVTGDLEAEE